MSTVINNQSINNNTINHHKTNRPLLSNIKNTTSSNPTTSLKKISIGVENIVNNNNNNNSNNKNKNNNLKNNNKNNILFTPSSSKGAPSKFRSNEGFLDLTSIQNDLKRNGIETTGGISPCVTPLKESVPISMTDLETAASIITSIKESIESESIAVVPVVFSSSVHTKTTNLENKVYSADFLMSFKSKNTVRPKEIDIVETHQKEIVVPAPSSLPTTPFNNSHFGQRSSNNNNNNNNNTQQQSTNQQKINNPIFSPQVSPFKIAYNSQSSQSLTSPNKQQPNVTPKKNNSSSTVTTPASYYRDNKTASVTKSNSKKQNPIPFALNNTTPTKVTKKATPKSNKKATINADTLLTPVSIADAITEESIEPNTDSTVPSAETPKKLRETDPKRLAARQRQIDIGKMTAGYKNYISTVPKSKRKPTDPKTPNKNQVCSKRSWDGQVKKWRRLLHQYDPTPVPFNEEEIEKEMKLMELEQKELNSVDDVYEDEESDNENDHAVPVIEN